jgi:F0F1-type ATP synthase delta subunit
MFRRVSFPISVRLAVAARGAYTPPADLQKLYESDFSTGKFPIDIVPSDSTLFAQFLYKAAEPKGEFDAILKDCQTVTTAGKKLPVFWERNTEVDTISEFKGLNPATMFAMKWMQKNGLLTNFQEVAVTYETLVNAQKKKHVAKIYVADEKADVKEAKEVAKKLLEGTPFASFSLDFTTVVDSSIASGYSLECAGKFYSTAAGHQTKAVSQDNQDFTNVPVIAAAKTTWEDSVETEVLARYLENLALFDAEEAKNGV